MIHSGNMQDLSDQLTSGSSGAEFSGFHSEGISEKDCEYDVRQGGVAHQFTGYDPPTVGPDSQELVDGFTTSGEDEEEEEPEDFAASFYDGKITRWPDFTEDVSAGRK